MLTGPPQLCAALHGNRPSYSQAATKAATPFPACYLPTPSRPAKILPERGRSPPAVLGQPRRRPDFPARILRFTRGDRGPVSLLCLRLCRAAFSASLRSSQPSENFGIFAAAGNFLYSPPVRNLVYTQRVRWCNGSTLPFGGICHGSNPCRTASFGKLQTPSSKRQIPNAEVDSFAVRCWGFLSMLELGIWSFLVESIRA